MTSTVESMDTCPLCCECYSYEAAPAAAASASTSAPVAPTVSAPPPPAAATTTSCNPHLKIICSAQSGCNKFHMCRLCVHRQTVTCSTPLIDEDTGDFCSIDPTACPQCKRSGAFVDSDLDPLDDAICRREAEEVQALRVKIYHRYVERMLRCLKYETRRIPYRIADASSSSLVEQPDGHPCVRQLNGYPHHVVAVRPRQVHRDILEFAEYSTVGLPELYTTTGVFYYEVVVMSHPIPAASSPTNNHPNFKCGFSLLDGIDVSPTHTGIGVGETCKSWAFDYFGNSWNGVVFADQRFIPNFRYPGCVIGLAVNLDKGMIACSTDGKWSILEKCGVKFEDECITHGGVYPCLSGRGVSLQVRYRPESLQYDPPPLEMWDRWPKYQDLSWITMPAEARNAAMIMGYTSTTWAWSGNPIDDKDWDDMTPEEQAAGHVLGYDKNIWTQLTTLWRRDQEDNSDSDSEGDNSFLCFSAMFWNDLPEDARRAAQTLGYSKTDWDEDSMIALGSKWFSQLTSEQKRAAIILGYDSQSWNEHTQSRLCCC